VSDGRNDVHRSAALYWLSRVCGGLPRVCDAQRLFDDLRRLHRSRSNDSNDADSVHALQRADLRAGLSGGCDKSVGRWRGYVSVEATLFGLSQLRERVPVWRAEVQHADAPADEMRHVLRPLFGRFEANVCERLSDRGHLFRQV